MQKATIGRIVHYTINVREAEQANKRRYDSYAAGSGAKNTGFVAHTGNDVHAGDTFPAIVVRENDGIHPNLQVFLDGNDSLWVTSAHPSSEDPEPTGKWAWPERIPGGTSAQLQPPVGRPIHDDPQA